MKKIKFPDKLWKWVEIALNDFIKVEEDPNYRVDMAAYHMMCGNICYVCFAGGVMAKTCGISPRTNIQSYIRDLPKSLLPHAEKFEALDHIRCGYIESAVQLYHDNWYDGYSNRMRVRLHRDSYYHESIPSYPSDQEGFKNGIKALIQDLKELDI